MVAKTKNILVWIFTIVVSLLIVSSGVAKLVGAKEVVEKLTEIGVGSYAPLFGIMEIAFIILFLIPKTIKIGFILITCYFAGAIATDLSHAGSIFSPVLILSLVWIAAFLRKPDIFYNTKA
ncbi:MAG TPA: DoxX family protein [Cyclobacteriaceae bacterium]